MGFKVTGHGDTFWPAHPEYAFDDAPGQWEATTPVDRTRHVLLVMGEIPRG